ncbi:prepilin-type N-terminal cleavage/methylation domain-containing protein [Hydrogenophaga sp. T2]|uniref:prepilin-type N-terminal cleavage/methylation domain-containing protein n=1 Tax=Hydrogenophaga sp. T2 TaxID=3132823 RepID=UPI003CE96AEF
MWTFNAIASKARHRQMRGFTLIEILAVFLLLALLLSLAAPRYLSTVDRSREKARLQNQSTIRDALDKFRADQGRYPTELTELVQRQYLRAIPIDPVSGTANWGPLLHPTGLEAGVYDVAAPKSSEEPD